MKPYSEKYLKRRKFFCVLPLLILPFITLAFWAVGGGKNIKVEPEVSALNKELPEAVSSGNPVDKLSMYNQAEKDSARIRESMLEETDMQQLRADTIFLEDSTSVQDDFQTAYFSPPGKTSDPYEQKINERIAKLRETINKTPVENLEPDSRKNYDDLESIPEPEFRSLKTTPDPELQQLDGMLEKLLDLQNPDRLQNKIKEQSIKSKGIIFPVLQNNTEVKIDVIKNKQIAANRDSMPKATRFIDISGLSEISGSTVPSVIAAVVHESVVLVNGAAVKLRLSTDVFIDGKLIPSGTLFSGIATLAGERLKIDVTAIRHEHNILPVSLTVYDLDAIEGIRIPETLTRESAKEGIDRAVQSVQLMSLDQSVTTQAATAGVEAVKGLFGKKARLIRVTVKAGHPVLLLNK